METLLQYQVKLCYTHCETYLCLQTCYNRVIVIVKYEGKFATMLSFRTVPWRYIGEWRYGRTES